MNKKFIFQFVFGLALIFGGFAATANAQGNVDISGSIGNGKLQKGKASTVTIVMNIPGDLHVNAANPLSKNAIPTRIKLSGAGLKFGAVSYPKGTVRKLSFSEDQLAVYEGKTSFRVPVTVPAGFKGDVAKIRVTVNYQSCSNEVCYRPRDGEITLSAAVK